MAAFPINVETWPEEFKPVMKAVKYALLCDSKDALFTHEEWALANDWLDRFSDLALENAV